MRTRVEEQVWEEDRCSGCGLCVALCSKGMLYWGQDQHPLKQDRQKALGLTRLSLRSCEVCQRFCELACPRLEELPAVPQSRVMAARAAGILQGGEPNDVIRALLAAARAADLIDGALVPDLDPWTLQPIVRIATTVDEIVSGIGMQYLWTPVLSALNETIFDRRLGRLAVVGPPCVAEAVSRLRVVDNDRLWPYKGAIRLTVATSCTGMYVPEMVRDLLERGLGIRPYEIRALSVSMATDSLTVVLWDGTERKVPLTEVKPFTRHGCGRCADYVGEFADVAVAAVGAPAGCATLITHSAGGDMAVRHAETLGLLQISSGVDEEALQVARTEKDRRIRAQAFDNLRILALDALEDPKKRAEVKKQFANLYGAAQKGATNKEVCHVSCSGC